MNAIAATEDNIQDQNLVNDQITAAIDKLSETASAAVASTHDEPAAPEPAPAADTSEHHEASATRSPEPAEHHQQPQPAPSILDEHQSASSDRGSLGSINLGSVPVETASHHETVVAEEAVSAEDHSANNLPEPAISGSDIMQDLPVPDTATDNSPTADETPTPDVPEDSPIAAPIAITTEESVAEESAPKEPKVATIDVKEVSSSDMDSLRSRALAELAPIVDNLDVSKEQKYHTVMDAFEVTQEDNMLHKAFDFASDIADEKQKAEALKEILDNLS